MLKFISELFASLPCFFSSVENTRVVSRNLGCKQRQDEYESSNKVDVLIPEVIQVTALSFDILNLLTEVSPDLERLLRFLDFRIPNTL